MRREAWGARPAGARDFDPPHLVDWPTGTYTGRALCGDEIAPHRLDPTGTAARVDVRMCPGCVRATGPLKRIRGGAQVLDLAARRTQRRLW